MVFKKNKKAAIEMSLNLIIMLIIGMVVLGLVIGFVNSLVNKGTESFDKQLGDNENLKLEEIKSCADVFCINPSPKISIRKGSKLNVFIKIRNVGSDQAVDISAGDATTDLILGVNSEEVGIVGEFIITGPGFKAEDGTSGMSAGQELAQMYTLRVSDETPTGTYYVSFGVDIDSKKYQKVVTVEVQ